MQSVNDAAGAIFTRDDQATTLRILERAFDAARARAAALGPESAAGPASPSTGGARDRSERLQADIARAEAEPARLRARARSARGAARRAAEQQLVVVNNRLELSRLRLDFIRRLQQFEASAGAVRSTAKPHRCCSARRSTSSAWRSRFAIIGAGTLVWRIAAYDVTDADRRRLLMAARNVVTVAAVALVLIFHFSSELAALVTVLGFAAAGIAFALQTVVLAVAGYLSTVAPNGIRVGDRVSLQGPFGYVHGEVVEIGFVRIRSRELAGEPLQPTGRIVVFPNSVVFTGSVVKHPAPSPDG